MCRKLVFVIILGHILLGFFSCNQNNIDTETAILKELKTCTKTLENEYRNQVYKLHGKNIRVGQSFFPYYDVYQAHDTILKVYLKSLGDSTFCEVYKTLIKKNKLFFDSVAQAGSPGFYFKDVPLFTFQDDNICLKAIPESYKKELIKQRVLRHWITCSEVIASSADRISIRCFQTRFHQFGFQLTVQEKDSTTLLKLKHTTYDNQNELPSRIEFMSLYRYEKQKVYTNDKKVDLKDKILFVSKNTEGLTIKTKPLIKGNYYLLVKVYTVSEHSGLMEEEADYSFDVD